MIPRRILWWLSLALFLTPLRAADISGTWNFKVTSPEGEHTAKLTVTQEGERIKGAFSSERGQQKVEGTVKGDQVHFTVRYAGGDEPMVIPFHGKLVGDKMSGQYTAGDTTGSWTAERAK